MKQDLVLPKFKLPGTRTTWVTKALWVGGGLVVLQLGALALVLWKNQSAGAPPTVVVAAPIPPVVVTARPVAPVHAQAAPALAVTKTADVTPAPTKVSARKARSSHRVGKSSSRTLAKASPLASKTAPKKADAPRNDAIDDLLKKFK